MARTRRRTTGELIEVRAGGRTVTMRADEWEHACRAIRRDEALEHDAAERLRLVLLEVFPDPERLREATR